MNEESTHRPQKPQTPEAPSPGAGKWSLIWLVATILLLVWMWGSLSSAFQEGVQISYSRFRAQVDAGNVTRITVKGDEIRGSFKNAVPIKEGKGKEIKVQKFVTYLPSFGDQTLLGRLSDKGVEVDTEPQQAVSWWIPLLNFAPFLLLIAIFYFLFSRMQRQGQSIFGMGRSRARPYDRNKEHTTFKDVAGARGAKTELGEVIEFLKDPAHFQRLGGTIPRGVLLVGPPGTGKTLLARAVAGEASVPFFSITGSDFMEMFVGVGASRVRDLFKDATKNAPSIIFIDELDSIGRRRGAGIGGGHDEREQTLNQLLSAMDGFEVTHSVIVMAATNRPDILDPALLRPGRFDRRITVDLPTTRDRFEILRIHARNKPLGPDVDLMEFARATPGFSGADLKNLLNEAAILAARKDKSTIDNQDIDEARDKVIMGLTRDSLVLTTEEKKLLAYHEGGHAIVAALLPEGDPVHKVSIVPRGKAMGVTQQLPKRDKYIYRRQYLLDRMAVMMGGRASEELVMDTCTSGAEDDLKQATRLARKMVLDWGMSVRFGHVALGGRRDQVFLGEELTQRREYSDVTAREVDEEIKLILDEAYNRAKQALTEHRTQLDRLAEMLVEHEEVKGDDVLKLLDLMPPESAPEDSRARKLVG